MNVYDILNDAAEKWGSHPAIFDEFGPLTFRELKQEADQLKDQLKAHGVKKGNALGVMARNSRQFIIGIFAGLGCGAVVMPISHQQKSSEIDNILHESKLHFIIDDHSGVNPTNQNTQELAMSTGSFRFAATGINKSSAFAPHIQNPAFIRFTSGTTGRSKGVIISHKSVLERIEAANKALQLGPEDTVIWVLPMAYHFVVSIVLYIRFGAAIAITKDFLANTIIDYTNRFNGTLLYAAPMHIRMLAGDNSGANLSSLKMVISTSAGISLEACNAFKDRFNIDVSQAYGIIEIGLPMINYKKSTEYPDAVGHALPDYQVEMLDENLKILPAGQIGKLAIKGPGMFDGYLSPPQIRKDILQKGWFMTGDLASKTEGGLVKVEGREKSMINVSGNKVFPEEVEAVLNSHPLVNLSRIYGNKHPLLGEIVEAEVILKLDSEISVEELLSYCRQKLSTYKVPQIVKFVKEIEMTGSGKVIRHS